MFDQETNAPARLLRPDRGAQSADIAQAIAAILATTRREWTSQDTESCRPDAAGGRQRIAHPLIRFALDAQRSNAWRARIGRRAWIRSVAKLAGLDRTPEGTG